MRLFSISSPTTIFRTVAPVVVYTIQSCFFLSIFRDMRQVGLIHVVLKMLKALPFISYSSTAVSNKRRNVRVRAAAEHIPINTVETSGGHLMRGFSFRCPFFSEATTRLAVFVSKIVRSYRGTLSTITDAIPESVFRHSSYKLYNS